MNRTEYESAVDNLLSIAEGIERDKRPSYTIGNDDVLCNFKVTADRVGITTKQSWAVHFEKHISALMSWCKNGDIKQGEPLEGRFADAINYLKLGYAIYQEEESK